MTEESNRPDGTTTGFASPAEAEQARREAV